MTDKAKNCWEYMKCGRQPGGNKADEQGICPAAQDKSFNGINRGKNAGRICWALAGTFCGERVQGSFAEKRKSCMTCDFYQQVQQEEGKNNSHTKFLRFLHQDATRDFFQNMAYRYIKAGERFVIQGEMEDRAYIIQQGSCLVIVEKDGELHPVDHYGKGDIVGGLGILTGEPRRAHVEAETDMEVWVLDRRHFENITEKNPDLLNFLTEVIANRFDSKRPTAYRTIGKYVATDIIGRGGFSIVYKGVHEGLKMPVAIKMMRHDMAMNPVFLNNFHNEARTIASLNHPNIIRVYDIEERYRTVFIIMEHSEGEGLNLLIKRLKKIPCPLAVDYLMQICAGLGYAHENGIIHRDINPTNIFIQPGDQVKILDFGLACQTGSEAVDFFGNLSYMAPEQVEGKAVDQRTDLYSVGILAYEMVTGTKPFPGNDPKLLEEMHLTQDIPDPAQVATDIPELLRSFILKACRRNPGQRYPNMTEASKALLPLSKIYGLHPKLLPVEKPMMTTLVLTYHEEQQLALSRLVEGFDGKARELGIDLKIAEFKEL